MLKVVVFVNDDDGKTAEEWLIEQHQNLLKNFGGISEEFEKLFDQALEMEKQQIENAKEEGYNFATSEAIKEIQKTYKK